MLLLEFQDGTAGRLHSELWSFKYSVNPQHLLAKYGSEVFA